MGSKSKLARGTREDKKGNRDDGTDEAKRCVFHGFRWVLVDSEMRDRESGMTVYRELVDCGGEH